MKPDIANPDNAELEAAVRALGAEARRSRDDHPSTEEVVEYHARALPADRAESIREHFAICPDCAQMGLDLAALAQSQSSAPEEEGRVDEHWVATREALDREGLLAPTLSEVSPAAPHGVRSSRAAYAMAALFMGATALLVLWLVMVYASNSGPDEPRANVQLVDLFPDGTGFQRAEGSPQPAASVGPEDFFVLILNGVRPGPYSEYQVEVLDLGHGEGEVVWSSGRLIRSSAGDFTLMASRQQLPAERYLLRLYGVEGTLRDPLAHYTLRLESP